MEAESIHVGATGIIGTFMTVMAFFGVRMVKQIDKNTADISEHKIEDAGKYATNSDVKESLNRVHDRIDDMGQDIKTLLARHV